MMTTIGKLEEFDSDREDWPFYAERLEPFFAANEITDASKKKSVLLSVLGATSYKLLRSLVSPAKPGDKDYADVVETMKSHYNPAPSEIVQWYKFHSRFREPSESVAKYAYLS